MSCGVVAACFGRAGRAGTVLSLRQKQSSLPDAHLVLHPVAAFRYLLLRGGYELASFTAEAAEAAYQELVELFQYEISGRIPILVYQSHHDFTVTNAVDLPDYSEGIGGVTELYKNRIAVPFMGDYRDYRRVVHHELVHAVLNDMFYGGSLQSILQNNLQLVLPLWFNEGLAEYAALGWDTNSDMYVREAILNDHLDPIPYLSGYFAYRGGQSVWDYIAEQYGREKIAEILQRVRLTHSVEAGIRQATGLSLRELSERWHKALREIYYPELTAREQLDDIGRPLLTARNAGYYNTSPALSPQATASPSLRRATACSTCTWPAPTTARSCAGWWRARPAPTSRACAS
ncbi:peptidase MA family metallohydrolase [Rhodothermus marinus]|uniref:peptidase MA family metallohydrolase n=1 Tax=Rhodothermus marinus TaxID=29549 RepID=UPI000AFFB50A|nr:peptidase MA family metallohydrolase [Rhodothermus marinus]